MGDEYIELELNTPGERLDKAVADALPNLSRAQLQRLIKEGKVEVDGRPAKASLRLEGGEKVLVIRPEPVGSELTPQDIPLDIRYQDDDCLVINKPAGMVVHPGTGNPDGTLVNALLYYLPDLKGVGGEKRPGIVHRLDKYTSGLIVVAKHDRALWHLQDQFKARTVKKEYLALVHGLAQPQEAIIDAPIGRDARQRKKMAVITARNAQSRPAQTHYITRAAYEEYSLLACHPITGRTHQIRVHLAYIGHPIVCDHVYSRRKQAFKLGRQFLHAARLTFRRPSDNEEITLSAELPPELTAVLFQLAG